MNEFHKNTTGKFGVEATCKTCKSELKKQKYADEHKEKQCTKCGKMKPYSQYWNNKTKTGGKEAMCIDCWKIFRKKQRKKKEIEEAKRLAGWKEKKIPDHIDLSELKTCSDCGEDKPLEQYYYQYKSEKFYNYCKPCHAERRKQSTINQIRRGEL